MNYDVLTYLGIGAVGTEFAVELMFWMLLVVGVCWQSWARGTLPMRYQIPMLFSSLQANHSLLIKHTSAYSYIRLRGNVDLNHVSFAENGKR